MFADVGVFVRSLPLGHHRLAKAKRADDVITVAWRFLVPSGCGFVAKLLGSQGGFGL